MKQISPRQKEVLCEIYSLTQRGLPPTFAELKDRLRISSNQTVKDHLEALLKKGYIKQERYKARSITISQKGFEEIESSSRKIEYFSDYNPATPQVLNDPHHQSINNNSTCTEEDFKYSEDLKINVDFKNHVSSN